MKDRTINIWCDNSAVVQIMTFNRTRDVTLGAILGQILMLQAKYNVELVVKHVMGQYNEIADALSRVHMDLCSKGKETLWQKGYLETEICNSDLILDLNEC